MPNNNMNFGVDLLPYATDQYELGNSEKKWKNIYATKINGLTLTSITTGFTIAGGTTSKTLTVPEDYTLAAACAKDVTDINTNNNTINVTSSDSNLITTRGVYYYITNSLTNYVTLDTVQTISGKKTFTNNITVYKDNGPAFTVIDRIDENTDGAKFSLHAGTGHTNHGIYSYGYVEDNGEGTSPRYNYISENEAMWLIRRDKYNKVMVGDSNHASRVMSATVGNSIKWIKIRDNAPLTVTSMGTNGLAPLASVATEDGAWDIASYTITNYPNTLIFSYGTNTNYEAGTNTTTKIIMRNDGGMTIPGPLILTASADAQEDAWHSPALCIGGNTTEAHIEIDPNEIIAKANATTMSRLFIQSEGGQTIFANSDTGLSSTAASVRFDGGVRFQSSVLFASGTIYRASTITKGQSTVSSDTGVSGMQFVDSQGVSSTSANRLGMIYNLVTTSKVVVTRIYAYSFSTATTSSCYFGPGYTSGNVARTYTNGKVYGAVWNDYAEYRKGEITEGGYCVTETPSGTLVKSTERLQAGCRITSDTFGFAIGETDTYQTPIAVSGRVLVYTYRPREEYPLGAALCSAPNGTVDIMTREEIKEYPERMIGIVSEIPDYEVWHGGGTGEEQDDVVDVPVNGRIWIYVR